MLERFGLIQEDKDARAAVKHFADTATSDLVKAAAQHLLGEKS